jgi:Ca2+-binding EF-hand superfamily protein
MKEKEKDIRREALQLIYADEIAKTTTVMNRRFKFIDEKNTGHITIKQLRDSMGQCALLTPKEINLIIRSIKPD